MIWPLILVPVLYVAFDRLRPKHAYVSDEKRALPLDMETSPG